MSTLKKLLKKELVRGLKEVKFEKDKLCSACQSDKQVANTHPTKTYMSTSRVLHGSIWTNNLEEFGRQPLLSCDS
jgi:hypothetical protein